MPSYFYYYFYIVIKWKRASLFALSSSTFLFDRLGSSRAAAPRLIGIRPWLNALEDNTPVGLLQGKQWWERCLLGATNLLANGILLNFYADHHGRRFRAYELGVPIKLDRKPNRYYHFSFGSPEANMLMIGGKAEAMGVLQREVMFHLFDNKTADYRIYGLAFLAALYGGVLALEHNNYQYGPERVHSTLTDYNE